MKNMKFNHWLTGGKLAATLAVLSTMLLITPEAQATPAFARQTGAACMKCHTASFPRLNWTGERFMRNGFALPKSAEGLDVGFPDEAKSEQKSDNLLLIQDVGKIFSVRGKIGIYEQDDTDSADKSVGSPDFFAIFASAQLAPDVPLWAEAETNTDTGETDVHNYFVGLTNVSDSTAINFRAGGFTPTEWTSMSDQKRSIDSVSSHPGSYRGKHRFTQVGNGLGTKTGLEYYGYNDNFLWAIGAGDNTDDGKGNFHGANSSGGTAYWLVGRADFMKGSSVSLLHMNYGVDNGSGSDLTSDTLSANWRINRDAELRAQYSVDNSGINGTDDVTGLTLQGDWTFAKGWTGIARYDTTDDGSTSDATETQATFGLVWSHWQNVKLTAAYVNEIDRAEADTPTEDSLTLQLQFAM